MADRWSRISLLVSMTLVLTLISAPSAAASVPPPNDDFDDATVVGGIPFEETISSVEANTAFDDPQDCFGVVNTVWYSYTPGADIRAEANTFGSDYDTVLAVYTGTRGALQQVACNDDAGDGVESRVRWDAEAGVTFYILAGALIGSPAGSLTFRMQEGLPAVDLGVTIDRIAAVNESEGTAVVSGTVTCSAPGPVTLFGIAVQFNPGESGGFIDAQLDCDGAVDWTVTVVPEVGAFTRGPGFAEAIVFDDEDNLGYAFREIMLRAGPNEPPTTKPDSRAVEQGAILRVPSPGVLGNDRDPEGLPLTAKLHRIPSRSGAFVFEADGSYMYRSEKFSFGPDTFTYRATDGFTWSAQTSVRIRILPSFSDTPASHPFWADIRWAGGQGVTRGCNPPLNDRYCPSAAVSRGQMAALIGRTLGLPDTPKDFFEDDDGTTFEADINTLARAGIVRGCNPPENTRFCPDRPMSRAEMATVLAHAFDFRAGGASDLFVDDDGSVHEASINRLGTAGVARGCNPPANDRFCPDDPVTRAQMAAFIRRAVGASGTVLGESRLAEWQVVELKAALESARP